MPYKVVKSGSGYKVRNSDTGKTYSRKPHKTKAKALAQMRAIYANTNESRVINPLVRKLEEAMDMRGISPVIPHLDAFTSAYMDTALWSSIDNGHPLDRGYDIRDISDETKAEMIADCADFQESAKPWLMKSDKRDADAQAGKDFWLTRNGHGAGFWDGSWGKEAGVALTKLAKSFGVMDLYVGDDGKIYS